MLVAAGRGERLGDERPKAFARLGDLPLLAEPLRRLDESDWIDGIVVVAPPEWEEPSILRRRGDRRLEGRRMRDRRRDPLGVGADRPRRGAGGRGGRARPRRGAALPAGDVVPRLLEALGEGFDGAVPGLPVADTVKRVRDGVVVETPTRDELVAVQTPQAFVASVLRSAAAGEGSTAPRSSRPPAAG